MKSSVALCTYNGERFLRKQINSILDQTTDVDEIVICDDGSTDNTLEILEEYKKQFPNIFKIHVNEQNLRSVKNFEKAISLCENDIIFLCDQDDIWRKEKVETYLSFFKRNIQINAVCSNGYGIDEKDHILDIITVWDIIAEQKKKNSKLDYFEIINFVGNFATGASMAFRKSFVSQCLPFPEFEDFHHDEWIALVAAYKNSFEFFPQKFFYYRQHENQQVGGVFFKNSPQKKKQLLKYFSIDDHTNKSFNNYKHILKRLSLSYKKNKILIETSDLYKSLFEENLKKIEHLFNLYTSRIKEVYPIKYFFLNILDTIKNKRKLN
ncbi:glycosyltransferase family 2 protein [Chryseobacterium endophyticum]|uniref:Glycosyltransferase family 2 protein n=1 Tax=Chryseobacterium endophyticum TaxID=1854762 RepID=A0AAU6WPP9_9FLAO|nr:glycosyltransferase family 2 protein [uncultured Chryseobacterium sp.]